MRSQRLTDGLTGVDARDACASKNRFRKEDFDGELKDSAPYASASPLLTASLNVLCGIVTITSSDVRGAGVALSTYAPPVPAPCLISCLWSWITLCTLHTQHY